MENVSETKTITVETRIEHIHKLKHLHEDLSAEVGGHQRVEIRGQFVEKILRFEALKIGLIFIFELETAFLEPLSAASIWARTAWKYEEYINISD